MTDKIAKPTEFDFEDKDIECDELAPPPDVRSSIRKITIRPPFYIGHRVGARKPPDKTNKPCTRVRKDERLSLGNFKQDELLLSTEAAQILGISPKTLDNWRWKGKGPQYHKIGGAVRYQVSELTNYIEMGQRSSTSDTAIGEGSDHE